MSNVQRFETDLPPELAAFVHARVIDGTFAFDGDVLREAVRQAAGRDAVQAAMDAKIVAGVASLRAGRGVDGETFMTALDADLAVRKRLGQ